LGVADFAEFIIGPAEGRNPVAQSGLQDRRMG